MSKLILSMDGLVLKEIVLTKERTTIGRRPHNDIVIDNLAVSGEHAVIVTILHDSFLEDLGSTNGTTVNGQPIKKHFLQANDVIELGKYKLKYLTDTASGDAPAEFDKTLMLRSPAPVPATPSFAHANAVAADGAAAPQAAIQILNGANAGKQMALVKPLTTLGRPGVQVAVITRRPQGYFITHVEGTNTPIVNGQALGTEACALYDRDVIELSGTQMEFLLK